MAEHLSADHFPEENASVGRSKVDIMREIEALSAESRATTDEARKSEIKGQTDALKKEYREADSSGEAHRNLEMVAQALVQETALPAPSTPPPTVEEPLSEKPAPIPDSSRQRMLKEIRPKYKPAPMPPKPDPSTVKTPAIHMTPEQGIVTPAGPEAAPLYDRAKEWMAARKESLEEAAGKHKGKLLGIGAALGIGAGVALLARSDTPPPAGKNQEKSIHAKKIETPVPPSKPESKPAPTPVEAAPDARLAEVKAKLAEHAGNFPAPSPTGALAAPPVPEKPTANAKKIPLPPLEKVRPIAERPPLPPSAEPATPNRGVPMPEAPQKGETFVNHIGLQIDRSQGHIFADSGGNVYAFGDDFEKRLAAANAYVRAHHEAIVYVQAAESTDSKPWVFEVIYKSGIFGGAPASILPLKGEPDAHQFGLISAESFTRQLDAPQ